MVQDDRPSPVVGAIGLGSMGLCLARRLLARGWHVVGHDPAPPAARAFADAGGVFVGDLEAVASVADILILALPTVDVFRAVIETLAICPREAVLLDVNTLLPQEKMTARDRLAGTGWMMLDGTISGTPEMVVTDGHSFYVSGDGQNRSDLQRLLADIAPRVFDMGSFGNAAAIKLVINHMVISHNVVAAEAMSLAVHAGLDPALAYETISASAGSSRIFEVRGRMMVTETYPEAAMYALIVDKDATIIADVARTLRHPVPMFAMAVQQHVLGMAQGWDGKDPASLGSMMERVAGVNRMPK